MNLLETDRLIRKLAAALAQPPEAAVTLPWAEEYVNACHGANLRLRKCEEMIINGDVSQAIQLAESDPKLLDLIVLLEFRESDNWRSYCQANRLPFPEPLDERAVQRLNEVYARGISTEDPLYRRYREAVLSKNERAAWTVLQTIARLNPGDANAASELARLDARLLNIQMQDLEQAMGKLGPGQVAQKVEAIEAAGFQAKPAGNQWREAQKIRCGCLLERAEGKQREGDWRATLSLLDLVQTLRSDYELQLAPEWQSRFASVNQWAQGKLLRCQTNEAFQKCLVELAQLLAANEEKDTMARAVPLSEIKCDYEDLHRECRAIKDFALVVPEELSARFHKRIVLLEAEIHRRTRRRVQAIGLGVAVCLVLGGLISWWGLIQFRAREFAQQLV